MAAKFIISLICLALATLCNGLNLCGMELIPKCALTETDCVEVLETALRTWYQTPQAKGYYVVPIDPLILDEFDVEVENQKIILRNVSISGLSKSVIKIDFIPPNILEDTYYHNVILTASSYDVKNSCSGRQVPFNTPVLITMSDMETLCDVTATKRTRCTGTTHAYLDFAEVSPTGGDAKFEGINIRKLGISKSNLETAITEKVAKVSTQAIYAAQRQLLSIALYSDVFI